MITHVERYFDRRYPPWRLPGLRAGEAARRAILAPWLRDASGDHVLDIGCGDGAFLASILPPRVVRVDLVDVSARQLARARFALRDRAPRTHRGELATSDFRAPIVTAFGVLDYCTEPVALVATLATRATELCLFDVPRSDTARSFVRACWLALHGLSLTTASRWVVHAWSTGLGDPTIRTTDHHHIVALRRTA